MSGNPFTMEQWFAHQLKDSLRAVCAEVVEAELKGRSRLLAPDELASALSISMSMLHRMRRQGMPTYWLGPDTPRFRFDEVMSWLDERDGIGIPG